VWNEPVQTEASPVSILSSDAAAAPMMMVPQPMETNITEAQKLLVKLGFNIGTPDGKMGSRTANAIRLFQLQSGLKVTGEVSAELLDAMRQKSG
jgi:peptidoglycan hydrolase-like protein with peptidoglycan-binding domain